jgi:hypothetical protein
MKLKIKEGTTSKLVKLFIQDSSATDGSGLTGLVYNSASLTAYYLPEGDASATAITLATATVGTYTSGGFKEVDATNMPGVYELGLPDAVIDATSEGSVIVMLKGATNMAPVLLEVELDAIDYQDSVRAGLTALPNAAADAAGGLPISDAGALDLDATVGALTFTVAGEVDANVISISGDSNAAIRLALSAAQIIPGTISDAVLSPSTTAFAADDITEATADHYNGRVIIFTSGSLLGQATSITDYSLVSSEGNFTVVAMTEAPANNDTFIII